jgi:hypothetical protein
MHVPATQKLEQQSPAVVHEAPCCAQLATVDPAAPPAPADASAPPVLDPPNPPVNVAAG